MTQKSSMQMADPNAQMGTSVVLHEQIPGKQTKRKGDEKKVIDSWTEEAQVVR
jgi:hypothetical protein